MWAWNNGDAKVLSELFQVRVLLEVEAAGLAAEGADAQAVAAIRSAFEQLVAAVNRRDVEKMADADVKFHRAIVVAARNNLMVTLLDSISIPLRDHRVLAFRLSGGHPQTIPNHEAILEAIEARDPKAAREAMKRHLDASETVFWDIARLRSRDADLSNDGWRTGNQ